MMSHTRQGGRHTPGTGALKDPRPRRWPVVDWGRLVAIWSVPALVSAFQSYGNMALHGEWPQLWPFAALSLGIWYSWVPLTPLVLALARRWPVVTSRDDGSSAPLWRHAAAGTAITLAHAFVWAQVTLVVQRRLEPAMVARYSTALVRLYLDIESTRFSDRLRVTYDLAPDTLAARVPDLVLQPLVENAIRHGIAPHVTAGCVAIRARRVAGQVPDDDTLVIEVQDDGRGPAAAASDIEGTAAGDQAGGVGLTTTRARFAALYGEDHARCELRSAPDGGCVARLVLPFRLEAAAGADAGGRGA